MLPRMKVKQSRLFETDFVDLNEWKDQTFDPKYPRIKYNVFDH